MFATFASTSFLLCDRDVVLKCFSIGFFKEAYGFGPGIGGLVYLGLGTGFVVSTLFGAKIANDVYKKVGRLDLLMICPHR